MSATITGVTVSVACDGYHCTRRAAGDGTTEKAARDSLRSRGWTFYRTTLRERTNCRGCEGRRQALIRSKVLSADGLVLDTVAYDLFLDEIDGRVAS